MKSAAEVIKPEGEPTVNYPQLSISGAVLGGVFNELTLGTSVVLTIECDVTMLRKPDDWDKEHGYSGNVSLCVKKVAVDEVKKDS